ncbi:Flp pilus assembly protein CpaB [Haloactinospora alba]|uniref:Flp pilus assembly protein CpaB n=1 Tax=Haloactinospora alba TaxID=405555 RepID=A0A543NEU8_9ACTN|nr:SAF domain-containing protein [Haloactinospora alba]TQN30280.1 Flp pilus assembly protein CpaB [Haloactinospora alba]
MRTRRRVPGAFLSRHRRAFGTSCAALAFAGAVLLLRPPPEPTTDVLVAAGDVSASSPLAPRDTTVRSLPREAVPDGALPPDTDTDGMSLTGPLRGGEVLTTARVADPPAAEYGADRVAAPVRVADAGALTLLNPGSRVDILAAGEPSAAGFAAEAVGGGPAERVVADCPVIAVPEDDRAGSGETGALLLVAVTPEDARALAGHAASSRLSVTIRG